MTNHDPARGALSVVLAAACFAAMGATIKVVSTDLPDTMVVFFRNLFGLLALVPWLVRVRPGLGTRRLRLHVLRVVVGLSAMYCFFWAIPHLALSEAVLLNYSAPLFIPFIAYFWLGETVAPAVRVAIVLGFIGIMLVLKPTPGLFQPAGLVALLAGMLGATAMTSIRRLSATEPAARIVFYFSLLGTLLSAVPLLWTWRTPSGVDVLLLGLVGLLATIGQLLMTTGYSLAPAAQVGPFIYTSVVFAGIYGWFLWSETPGPVTIAGMVLVVLAGVLALRRQPPRVETPAGASRAAEPSEE
ncbi:MAG TPA: DMT family transporter [Gammaproteobacteria bacterium]|nr:DMT family transporter [Gammaproteobacteria bacterium]